MGNRRLFWLSSGKDGKQKSRLESGIQDYVLEDAAIVYMMKVENRRLVWLCLGKPSFWGKSSCL